MTYYVNKNAQVNGDHEVHKSTCPWLPNIENRIYLGEYYNSHDAVRAAKKYYIQSNGCVHCCPESHTS